MSEVSVWASMQPAKQFNPAALNPNIGPDAAKPIGAPTRLADVAEMAARPVVPGSSLNSGGGTKTETVPQHITDLYANRFGTASRPQAAVQKTPGIEVAVVAKMQDIQSRMAEVDQSQIADSKAIDMALATSRAEAAFDGANNRMAQDRELFKAIAKDWSQSSGSDAPREISGEDSSSKIAKDRAAIAAQREEDQAVSMVLSAEASGTGDRYNPTLDLTY